MIFNNIDFSNCFKILDIRKGLLPPIQNQLYDIPGKRGSMLRNSKLLSQGIEIDLEFKGKDKFEETIRNLSKLLYTEGLEKLIFPNEQDKYYLAKLDGSTDLGKILYYGVTTLRFITPDPVAFGTIKTIILNKDTNIVNIGTEKTTGTITINITESVNHIQVTLQNTGEYIYLEHNFAAGDTVVIDLEKEIAYKNGYSVMKDCYLESDFFHIPVGEFRITLNTGNAILEYIERWL